MASKESERLVSWFDDLLKSVADRLHKIDIEKKKSEMELDKTKRERDEAKNESARNKLLIKRERTRANQADDKSTCSLLWLIAVCIGFAIYFTWTQLFW
ncbi:hypothetical protein [Nitrosomonas sp.]|uniref:hypothetical protein n=1 Tax=Nitrosomonas sp. TaxID=42353 RepID=UPI0025D71250|nr:hypothetical protein [Nitrosomonas sp.]